MALTRYQIRNEYGLADKELYRTIDKEDPEALFDATSIAGLVGVLRQLGDLAEFGAEVFDCLHEEVMKSAARGNGLARRLKHLEVECLSIEIPILSQTQHSTFFYHPSLEWHPNLQIEENMIASRNFPPCIMDSYEECRGPPQLFLLDKFDVVGSGSCLKRYSDPTLFKTKLNKDERPLKPKKKSSHTTKAETPEDSKTSHTKLNQLFLLEHVENGHRNLEFHVKLKRRQLNRPPNSSSRIGYMENFLKNSSPHCETEVEDLPIPSLVYPNGTDIRKHTEMEMESIVNDETLEAPLVPEEIKSLHDSEGGPEICLERSSSLSLCCNLDELEQTPFKNPLINFLEGSGVSLELQSNKGSVETESEISLIGLVEDQFSSITNQEIDALKPTAMESDSLLPNQYITTFDTFEDLSVPADAEDNVVLEEDETNSPDGSCMNTTEQSSHIPNLEITSENKNLSASSRGEDVSAEVSSFSEKEDPESMSIVSDDSNEHEVPILDKGSENVPEIDLECNSHQVECLLGTQECQITTSAEPTPCLVSTQDGEENCLDLRTETPDTVSETTPPPPPLLPLPPTQWWNEPTRETEEQSPSAVNGTSNTYIHNDEGITPECLLDKKAEESFDEGLATDWRNEAMALEWFSQNLLEHNPAKLGEEPQLDHPLESPRVTKHSQNSNDENEKAGKVTRDKDSLVIGIDRSMLRKVAERNKTEVRARVDENGSLLEIIRNKSFNLRRADASVRPNFQVAVPMTNLKVAAILEKANTLRQAIAGSDEEHDSDSWSE